MWVSAATSAAAAQAASGEPKASECRLRVRDCVTAEKQCRSPGTSEAASLISARTGGGAFVTPRGGGGPPARADDLRVGDGRGEPVREVDQLAARDAGEEVLV